MNNINIALLSCASRLNINVLIMIDDKDRRHLCKNNGPYKFRSNSRLHSTSIYRLRNREIFGTCNKSQRYTAQPSTSQRKVFTCLPQRLAIPLVSLVDDSMLHDEAHIFLGFSSCDRFLISYTERIEEASHTGFLSHIYTLHWWLFNPGKRVKKIGCIRLFANEEIEYSLYLCYAEWPNLKSQVVVYGWRKFSESCYISIVAVPSTEPCSQCNIVENNYGNIENSPDITFHNRCLNHGFAMHFKQASGASRLGVLNMSGLKIDGILVLNIGHSIAVISTGILLENVDIEKLPLSSIKRAACEESMEECDSAESNDNGNFTDDMNADYKLKFNGDELVEKELRNLQSYTKQNSQSCKRLDDGLLIEKVALSGPLHAYSDTSLPITNNDTNTSVYDLDSDDSDSYQHISLQKSSTVENKENISKFVLRKSANEPHRQQMEFELSVRSDPYIDPEPKSIVLGSASSTTCDMKSSLDPQKHRTEKFFDNLFTKLKCARNSACTKSIINNSADKCSNCADNSSESKKIRATFLSPALKSSILSIKNKNTNNTEIPRSELNFVTPSPTPSECSSIHCSTDSHLFQSNTKPFSGGKKSDGLVSFSESLYGSISHATPDDPLSAGENSMFYCSMFCQGAAGQMLHPLKMGQGAVQTFSQHLVLDLEHVIFDILRTRCYMTYKYGYLVDYEANVMEVCNDTKSVIIHIVALLNVAKHRHKTISEIVSNIDDDNVGSTLQQAEFTLCWQLNTGRYEVVIARPIKPYNEKKSGDWKGDWIVTMDACLRQQCAIRSNTYRSVYILDNSAVFRHQSLNVLWNCDKTLAVTR